MVTISSSRLLPPFSATPAARSFSRRSASHQLLLLSTKARPPAFQHPRRLSRLPALHHRQLFLPTPTVLPFGLHYDTTAWPIPSARPLPHTHRTRPHGPAFTRRAGLSGHAHRFTTTNAGWYGRARRFAPVRVYARATHGYTGRDAVSLPTHYTSPHRTTLDLWTAFRP